MRYRQRDERPDVMRLLIANRGEIALRIIRTATELGLGTVAVYAEDDADSSHVHAADEAIGLPGTGPAGYLDHAAILAAAKESGAEQIHPGYGFLSEQPEFARACAAAGYTFVGPDADALELFGNKSSARHAAAAAGVPVLPATDGPSSVEDIRRFAAAHAGDIVIKALAGGGGRGMRIVRSADQLDDAYRQCAAEAELGFGDRAVFAEAHQANARHIEVQIVAAPSGPTGRSTSALALGDRDCSIQRRNQKIVEIAPAQALSGTVRRDLHAAAARLCAQADYRGLATVEFLVSDGQYVFLEVNPRIQVEHTITEETTGLDLVSVQLAVARGATFDELGLPAGVIAEGADVVGEPAVAHGIAIQTRVNMETLAADGSVSPTTGTLTGFTPPTGPGVRVDTHGRPGYTPSPRYDSLLAKVITHVRSSSYPAAVRKAQSALAEFRIEGIRTNIGLLREVLSDARMQSGSLTTSFIDENLAALVGQSRRPEIRTASIELHPGEEALRAQLAGTVVEVVSEGAEFPAGAQLAVLEAMKMQHVLTAPDAVHTVRTLVMPGQVVATGDPLVVFSRTGEGTGAADAGVADLDLGRARADLDEVRRRHSVTLDDGRPAAVTKRHKQNRRTARENIADLVDSGSFVEYGALTVAAQRSRRSEEDLIANTPADGLVAGVAKIGGAEAVVLSYDYTVLAGTQGMRNHAKTDRVFELAARRKLPVVLFAEGGGGRPGDTDLGNVAGLDVPTFRALGALSGQVPLVSIVSGRCFAGNAALAGVCDVIIATPDANIGMGGPAMIEGGGLGEYRPEDIGPIDVQRRNGVVGLAARDEAHAVWPSSTCRTSTADVTTGRLRIRDGHDMWCRRTGYVPTTCITRSKRSPTWDPFWSYGQTTASAW
jgi:acetyl/propionyl-CoA carboxylase alpha subunit/acetyl-CoA carboxylase beta subunit